MKYMIIISLAGLLSTALFGNSNLTNCVVFDPALSDEDQAAKFSELFFDANPSQDLVDCFRELDSKTHYISKSLILDHFLTFPDQIDYSFDLAAEEVLKGVERTHKDRIIEIYAMAVGQKDYTLPPEISNLLDKESEFKSYPSYTWYTYRKQKRPENFGFNDNPFDSLKVPDDAPEQEKLYKHASTMLAFFEENLESKSLEELRLALDEAIALLRSDEMDNMLAMIYLETALTSWKKTVAGKQPSLFNNNDWKAMVEVVFPSYWKLLSDYNALSAEEKIEKDNLVKDLYPSYQKYLYHLMITKPLQPQVKMFVDWLKSEWLQNNTRSFSTYFQNWADVFKEFTEPKIVDGEVVNPVDQSYLPILLASNWELYKTAEKDWGTESWNENYTVETTRSLFSHIANFYVWVNTLDPYDCGSDLPTSQPCEGLGQFLEAATGPMLAKLIDSPIYESDFGDKDYNIHLASLISSLEALQLVYRLESEFESKWKEDSSQKIAKEILKKTFLGKNYSKTNPASYIFATEHEVSIPTKLLCQVGRDNEVEFYESGEFENSFVLQYILADELPQYSEFSVLYEGSVMQTEKLIKENMDLLAGTFYVTGRYFLDEKITAENFESPVFDRPQNGLVCNELDQDSFPMGSILTYTADPLGVWSGKLDGSKEEILNK